MHRDSQGLRRPRFSFFIFTCQTARGPETPLPFQEGLRRPHSTTNDNRLASAVNSLILVRSFTGTKTCLGQEPRQCRAQWAVYKPAQSSLSTVCCQQIVASSNRIFRHREASAFGLLAALEPQSCDVLRLTCALNRRVPVGAVGVLPVKGSAIFHEPSPFLSVRETSRDLHTLGCS